MDPYTYTSGCFCAQCYIVLGGTNRTCKYDPWVLQSEGWVECRINDHRLPMLYMYMYILALKISLRLSCHLHVGSIFII